MLATGAVLGDFRVEGEIGRGGMGVVYRAAQISLGRPVALKVISETLSDRVDFRDRFVRESRLAASLDHPNVIPVYGAGEQDGVLYIAMRFVDGTDLRALLAAEGALEPASCGGRRGAGGFRARRRSRARARASRRQAREHPRGGSGRRRTPYLTDFGLTKRTASDSGLTAAGEWVGTLDYVAPEQLRGERSTAVQTSTPSAACSTSCSRVEVPFERDDDIAKLWAHISDAPPSALDVAPGTPRGLARSPSRCMEKDPDDRFETAGQMGRAALAAVPGLGDTGTRARLAAGRRGVVLEGGNDTRAGATAVLAPQPGSRRFTRGRVAATAAALLLACVVAVVLLATGDDGDPSGATETGPPVGTIDARIPVGDSPAGVGLEGDFAWVANEGDGTLTRIDLKTQRPRGKPIPVGKNPRAVATRAGSVWVANFGGGSVTRVDADSGRILQTIPVGRGPIDIAVGRESVWVSTEEARVVRIDASSGKVIDRDIGVKAQGALDLGLGRLWIADRIEGTLRVYFIKDGLISNDPLSLGDAPSDIAVGPRFAWAAVAGDGVIRRVPISGESGERVIETAGRPEVLGVSKQGIWVADSERETLYRISRKTGRPLGTPIKVSEDPSGIAVGREAVWVTSAVTDSVLRVVPR